MAKGSRWLESFQVVVWILHILVMQFHENATLAVGPIYFLIIIIIGHEWLPITYAYIFLRRDIGRVDEEEMCC